MSQPARKVGREKTPRPACCFAKEQHPDYSQKDRTRTFSDQLKPRARPDHNRSVWPNTNRSLLDIPTRGTINIHPSLLPIPGCNTCSSKPSKWRQRNWSQHLFTWKNGCREYYRSRKYDIKKDDTTVSTYKNVWGFRPTGWSSDWKARWRKSSRNSRWELLCIVKKYKNKMAF